jgi:hypothetical protein
MARVFKWFLFCLSVACGIGIAVFMLPIMVIAGDRSPIYPLAGGALVGWMVHGAILLFRWAQKE